MTITGIPDYDPAIEQGVRCVCGRYYVVFTGSGMIESAAARIRSCHLSLAAAEARARRRAGELHARFVDARAEPLMMCGCGQVLDFSSEYSESGAGMTVQ